MASDHPILGRLETLVSRYRDDIARLTPELAHLRSEREIVMQYLSEFGTSLNALINARQASDDKAASEGKRADTAEADAADLRKQIAADEATLKSMLDAADAEVEKETAPAPTPSAPSSDATVTTSVTGATVTASPTADAVVHVTTDGTTTTVPHDGSAATAIDASGTPVEPAPSAVAEAVTAAAAVGVTVPAADPVIPTAVG